MVPFYGLHQVYTDLGPLTMSILRKQDLSQRNQPFERWNVCVFVRSCYKGPGSRDPESFAQSPRGLEVCLNKKCEARTVAGSTETLLQHSILQPRQGSRAKPKLTYLKKEPRTLAVSGSHEKQFMLIGNTAFCHFSPLLAWKLSHEGTRLRLPWEMVSINSNDRTGCLELMLPSHFYLNPWAWLVEMRLGEGTVSSIPRT